MMRRKPHSPRSRRAGETGLAAMEFVLVFPLLLILLVGLVNVSNMVSMYTSLATAAELTGDLVARSNTTVSATTLDDYIAGAQIVLGPFAGTNPRIEIYGYTKDTALNKGKLVWKRLSASTAHCTPAPATVALVASDPVGNLLGSGSDVILVRVCATFTPPLAKASPISGGLTTINMERQIVITPRESTTLACSGCT